MKDRRAGKAATKNEAQHEVFMILAACADVILTDGELGKVGSTFEKLAHLEIYFCSCPLAS